MRGGEIVDFVYLERDVGTKYKQLCFHVILHWVNSTSHKRRGPMKCEFEVIPRVRDHDRKISATFLTN